MKKFQLYIFFPLLVMPFCGFTMEKPSTPKRVRLGSEDGKKLVEAAKLKVLNIALEAITGSTSEEPLDLDSFDNPEDLSATPKTFFKKMRKVVEDNFSIVEKDITQKSIQEKMKAARESLEASTYHKDYYEQLSSPLKKEIDPVFKDQAEKIHMLQAEIDDVAVSYIDAVVVNPTMLHHFASTPRRRNGIFKHERAHIENDDHVKRKALFLALEEQRLKTAPSKQAVLANPYQFSPSTKAEIQMHSRIGEVFADIEAANSPNSADAISRLCEQELQLGDKSPSEHPSYSARLKIAKAMSELHAAVASRKRSSESQPDESKRKKSNRRLDFDEQD